MQLKFRLSIIYMFKKSKNIKIRNTDLIKNAFFNELK